MERASHSPQRKQVRQAMGVTKGKQNKAMNTSERSTIAFMSMETLIQKRKDYIRDFRDSYNQRRRKEGLDPVSTEYLSRVFAEAGIVVWEIKEFLDRCEASEDFISNFYQELKGKAKL